MRPLPGRKSLGWVLCAGVACGGAAPVPAPAPAPPRAPALAAPPTPPSGAERTLAGELRRVVQALAGLGERSVARRWELAGAADLLAQELEAAGTGFQRFGYEADDGVTVHAFEVTLPGGSRGDEAVVVSAHYDTAPGSPGANADASGVAALLALVKLLAQAPGHGGVPPDRQVRLALLPNGAPPWHGTPLMGSVVYARRLLSSGVRVVGVLCLGSVGYYSDAPGSQRSPGGVGALFPRVGNFVAVLGDERSRALVQATSVALRREGSLPVEPGVFEPGALGLAGTGPTAYWDAGIPAALVTDTAAHRDPEHGRPGDLPDRLDYHRMARLVLALAATVRTLASDPPP